MAIIATHHCPCCGNAMDTIDNIFEFPTFTRHVIQVTCFREGECEFATYTVSPDRANDTGILRSTYHVTKKFDVYTGEKVNE